MTDNRLQTLLDAMPYPLLYVIAQQRGLTIPRNAPKAELVAALLAAFSDLDALQACLDALSPAERAVLYDLVLAGGRLPRYHIARRHGDFREYRPWMPDSPARPWETPVSPTERLYFLGLILWDKANRDLVIPAELLPYYPAPALPAPPAPAQPLDADRSVPPVLHDVAQLLALIAAAPPHPAHGRWLPPSLLRAWGQVCAVPPAQPDAPSELRTRRRRYLHYLTTATGLVAPAGPVLALPPAAWAWLEAPPAGRLATLWGALTAPPRALWATFRLPGHRLGLPGTLANALTREINATLRDAPGTHCLGTAEAVAARLLARDPIPHSYLVPHTFEPEHQLTGAFVALLTGPWTWLGAVSTGAGDTLSLTAWGAFLLEHHPPPDTAPPPPFILNSDAEGATLTFTAPGSHLDPLALVTLAACAERANTGGTDTFRITHASWTRALHRGYAADALLARLNAIAQRPLSGADVATLTGWAQSANRMAVQRLTVLEVSDPAILARLHRTQRGRRLVLRTLSSRAVVVDEGKLPLLLRRLNEQESAAPRVDLPAAVDANTPLGRGGAALLWLAATVYRKLGGIVALPARLPSELLDLLSAQARPEELAAAEAAAQRTLDALHAVLQGRAAFPVWTQPTLPVEESLALIERALAEGAALAMDYYTAGRDEVTHRVVEPYRVEHRSTRHGDETYLVGFCHRAQAERVFRVDRIRALTLAPVPDTDLDAGDFDADDFDAGSF